MTDTSPLTDFQYEKYRVAHTILAFGEIAALQPHILWSIPRLKEGFEKGLAWCKENDIQWEMEIYPSDVIGKTIIFIRIGGIAYGNIAKTEEAAKKIKAFLEWRMS